MEDGGPSQNTMSGTVLDNAMDFDLMEELLYDGFWLETSEGSHFWQPGPSTSSALNFSSYHTPTSETNINLLNPNLHQKSDQEGRQRSGFVDNPPLVYPLMDDLVGSQIQKQESSSGQSENFPVESSEMNRRLWVAPSANSGPNSSVKKRLMQAIEYLTESTRERDLLIQIWVPIKKGGKNFLTTNNQPFSLNPKCKSLADYRDVSRGYHFAAEEDSKDFVGLPGRVFLKKLPEWTPDVRFFKREEYPRVGFACQYNVSGSVALPVFERGSGNCLGVVEIVTTSQKVHYRPELENVCKALEAVDLRSTEISSPPSIKACNDSYQIALAEIQEVLKSVCDKHGLPLAQTWASCFQQGKGGCRHSNENYPCCVSTIDSACYVLNPRVLGFQEACSEHHLLRGEGVAGGAFMTTQPCFAPDVTAFSKTEYPLSHHARIFGLHAAVAIRLRSIYTGSADFVLEFFLPSECQDAEEQRQVLTSLTSDVQQFCRSLHCVTELELAEEAALSERVIAAPLGEENSKKLISSLFEEPPQVESSWIDTRETQRKGKAVSVSVGYQKEEPQEDFKETIYWGKYKRDLYHANTFLDQQVLQESGSKGGSETGGDFSSAGGQHISGLTKGYEKRRTKSEKTISLQVLQQYFAGSLKDAAKSIGVCPTTLKRICRQHGITRWPSRKIKKVGHSLKKLQLVIDSVQGVEGAIQLSSFYSNFPEFSSPKFPVQNPVSTSNRNDPLKQFNVQTDRTLFSPVATTSKSPSSSCSQSSSSSFSSSMEAKQPPIEVPVLRGEGGDASLPAPAMVIKRAHSEAELRDSGQEDTKLLVRSHSQRIFSELPSPEVLPSLPKVGSQSSKEGGGFRAKATFRDEKIRLTIQPNWSFGDLKQEIAKRFNIEERQIDLKYLDDDSEWVLLTCDADLEECIDIHKSSKSRTIKLAVH